MPAPPPRPSGPPSSRSTSASSRCAYDDVELLGRFVTDGRAAYPIGLALHSPTAPCSARCTRTPRARCPFRPSLRGPLAGWPSTWRRGPGTAALTRVHPASGDLPELWGSGRAFAQATWRHLLFGAVLGELERRLNPPDSEPQPDRPRGGRLQRPRVGRVRGVAQLIARA